jgi:hypothetical protein
MSGRRLTKQQYDAIISAMNYYETIIEEGEMNSVDPPEDWRAERRHHESAMEWLRSVQPGREVTR